MRDEYHQWMELPFVWSLSGTLVVGIVLAILTRGETQSVINQLNGDTISPFGKYIGGLPDANRAVDILNCVITNTGAVIR